MVLYFNKKDLSSFGEYLLSEAREETLFENANPKLVFLSDVENWLELERQKKLKR